MKLGTFWRRCPDRHRNHEPESVLRPIHTIVCTHPLSSKPSMVPSSYCPHPRALRHPTLVTSNGSLSPTLLFRRRTRGREDRLTSVSLLLPFLLLLFNHPSHPVLRQRKAPVRAVLLLGLSADYWLLSRKAHSDSAQFHHPLVVRRAPRLKLQRKLQH